MAYKTLWKPYCVTTQPLIQQLYIYFVLPRWFLDEKGMQELQVNQKKTRNCETGSLAWPHIMKTVQRLETRDMKQSLLPLKHPVSFGYSENSQFQHRNAATEGVLKRIDDANVQEWLHNLAEEQLTSWWRRCSLVKRKFRETLNSRRVSFEYKIFPSRLGNDFTRCTHCIRNLPHRALHLFYRHNGVDLAR